MKAVVQNFIGTLEEWNRFDPRLFKGVLGIAVTPEGHFIVKIGDGRHKWQALHHTFDKYSVEGLAEELGQLTQAISAEEASRAQDKTELLEDFNTRMEALAAQIAGLAQRVADLENP
jgi:hypothetical protein